MENQTQPGFWFVYFGCNYHGYTVGGCESGIAGYSTERGTSSEHQNAREQYGTDGIGDFVPDQLPASVTQEAN